MSHSLISTRRCITEWLLLAVLMGAAIVGVNTLLAAHLVMVAAACLGLAVFQRQRLTYSRLMQARERRGQESAEYLRLALSGGDLGLWDLDFRTGRLNVDAGGRRMLGYGLDDLGHDVSVWQALVHPEDSMAIATAIEQHLSGQAPSYSVEHRSKHKDGRWVWLLSRAKVTERSESGAPLRMIGTQMDITERKENEFALQRANAQLTLLTTIDALTRIGNRRMFDDALRHEWTRAVREGEPMSLLMVDIDHFKQFNDHHGHPEGDATLAKVALVLSRCAQRPADVVARYGGEEFALLLPHTGEAGAKVVAQRCLDRTFEAALPHGASPVASWVTCSIGLASTLPRAGMEAEALVKRADTALYEAKRGGRAPFECAPGERPEASPRA